MCFSRNDKINFIVLLCVVVVVDVSNSKQNNTKNVTVIRMGHGKKLLTWLHKFRGFSRKTWQWKTLYTLTNRLVCTHRIYLFLKEQKKEKAANVKNLIQINSRQEKQEEFSTCRTVYVLIDTQFPFFFSPQSLEKECVRVGFSAVRKMLKIYIIFLVVNNKNLKGALGVSTVQVLFYRYLFSEEETTQTSKHRFCCSEASKKTTTMRINMNKRNWLPFI